MTNDFNLNRIARLEGVAVLNLNELAQAMRPVAIPGEEIVVTVAREGKEPGQGVGSLDDGTMVVIATISSASTTSAAPASARATTGGPRRMSSRATSGEPSQKRPQTDGNSKVA
jgi:hypothetical protein